jgi:histidinol-phosphate aminotransferase
MDCDLIALAAAGVRGLRPYQPGKPIEELERELGIRDPVKLASNENPLGPSPAAVQAMQGALGGVSRYPDGNGHALKRALARRLGVGPECITLGNGSNDILELVARAFLGPGREAVISAHAFAVYPIVIQAVGAEARVARPNAPDHAMPYGHDLQAMAGQVGEHTRVVFVANPNNPTGTWLQRQALQAFLEALPETTLCVIDEAYLEYVQEPAYPDALTWLGEHPGLIVTRTFSKIYGLAGVRVGYGISHPQVAELLNRVRQPFNCNSLAQTAALAALDDEDHLRRSRELNAAGLAQLTRACEERGLGHIPSVANFLCIDLARPAVPVYEALLREGVIVRPVDNYALPNHLRVSVGTPEQNARLIQALDRVLGT